MKNIQTSDFSTYPRVGRENHAKSFLQKIVDTTLGILFTFILFIAYYPDWLGTEKDSSDILRNLVLVSALFIGFPLALWRSFSADRQSNAAFDQSITAQEQSRIAQRTLRNSRFQVGSEMLSHSDINTRLSGVYSLGGLAQEDPETYHIQIMQILCAFIVERSNISKANHEASLSDFDRRDMKQRTCNSWRELIRDITIKSLPNLVVYNDAVAKSIIPEGLNQVTKDVSAAIDIIAGRSEVQIRQELLKYVRLDLSGAILCGLSASASRLEFINIDFVNTDFRNARLEGANFPGADLSLANFSGANLRASNFRTAILSGASFIGADLTQADLSDSKCQSVSRLVSKKNIPRTKFVYADLSHVNFNDAILVGSDFRGAKLNQINANRAMMQSTKLTRAIFDDAELTRANLLGADLSFAICISSALNPTLLAETNLQGAILSNSKFHGASLYHADLTDTDFSRMPFPTYAVKPAMGLTTAQVNEGFAVPDRAPKLDSVLDSSTGEQIIWG